MGILVAVEGRVTVYRPKRSSWTWLAVAVSPIFAFSFWGLLQRDFLVAVISFAFASFVVAYNLTMRLAVDGGSVRFSRYGQTIWSAPLDGIAIEEGKGGDGDLLPAYVVKSHGERVGFLLKGWFAKEVVEDLQKQLRKEH